MKLAYSINGEGFGHAARLAALLPQLQRWHRIEAFAPVTVRSWLESRTSGLAIHLIPHYAFVQRQDRIMYQATLLRAVPVFLSSIGTVLSLAVKLRKERFDGVISDFEPMLSWAGRLAGLRVLQFNHPGIILRYSDWRPAALASRLVALLMEGPWHRRIHVSFFGGQLGPLVRPELLAQKPSDQGFLLLNLKPEYRAPVEAALENCRLFKPTLRWRTFPDPQADFDQALVSCSAVISSAGHQIISEALVMGKPILVLPQQGQDEQALNARMLAQSGRGMVSTIAALPADLPRFLDSLPALRSAFAQAEPPGYCLHDCSEQAVTTITRQFMRRRDARQEPETFDIEGLLMALVNQDMQTSHDQNSDIERIAVLGCGYVGLLCSAGFARLGHRVTGIDLPGPRIAMLQQGKSPLHEPGLDEILTSELASGHLDFTTDSPKALDDCDTVFVAVGTPDRGDGSSDLSALWTCMDSIATALQRRSPERRPLVVVIKSTVPTGTNDQILDYLVRASGAKCEVDFSLVSNPEFLREGKAAHDFFHPERTVLGCRSDLARTRMEAIYAPLSARGFPMVFCDPASAELAKYAANAFLAVKISFINQMANFADACGADITQVSRIMGMDSRIGAQFLNPGPGYGGSCFPKDSASLLSQAESRGVSLDVVEASVLANHAQAGQMIKRLCAALDVCSATELAGKRISVLGLAFKPDTDDVRESPSLRLVEVLRSHGAVLRLHDPVAMANFQSMVPAEAPAIVYAESMDEAIFDADAAIIVTDWTLYRSLDLTAAGTRMRRKVIVDCRNVLDPRQACAAGYKLATTGRQAMVGKQTEATCGF